MRPTHSVAQVAVALLSLAPAFSAAWPGFLPDMNTLVVRQNDDASPSPAPTDAPKPTDAAGDDKTTTGKKPIITTNLNTGGKTESNKSGSKTTAKAKPTNINPQDPAAAVVMITPGPFDGYPLYKIGDYVTWAWNYTHLQASPTAINMLASATGDQGPVTVTITQNMTFATPATFVWDTKKYNDEHVDAQLPMLEYKLAIYDADSAISAAPEAGYLTPFTSFTFGLYEPKAGNGDNNLVCVTCSGAMSDMERRVLGSAVGMSVITVLSFTWFVGGFAALL